MTARWMEPGSSMLQVNHLDSCYTVVQRLFRLCMQQSWMAAAAADNEIYCVLVWDCRTPPVCWRAPACLQPVASCHEQGKGMRLSENLGHQT